MYVTLFPQLVAGPIVRYKDIDEQLRRRKESVLMFACGVRTFICGLCKKVLFANTAGAFWTYIKSLPESDITVVGAWLGIIAFSFQIYFDFSGYSDMAIGLGKMFGFTFLENFNYPYISKSITEFWRRWHI
jgi:alginate O-acetyltransferase complex protein AlgI